VASFGVQSIQKIFIRGDVSMIRMDRVFRFGILAACLGMASNVAFGADDAAAKAPAKTEQSAKAAVSSKKAEPAKPKRTLAPALVPLRDLVRQSLDVQRQQAFNSNDNTPTEILGYNLGFGCNTEVTLNNGQRINGITCLCWNYPCAGFEMLGYNNKRVAAKIGYGSQERPGEFLAMLALSRVPSDYPVRVGQATRTVADIVESEKLSCRSGSDLSLKLVGLSFYVDEPEWKNDLGETWSIERVIREEIGQPVVSVNAPESGLNRLMGLSVAVARRAKRDQAINGQFQRAQKYTSDFQEFALQLQNSDGSWGPYFLAARSTSPDVASQLRSTGRILEWLAMSLPDKKLEDARVTNAVQCVANILGSQQYQNVASLSTRDIVSVGHAIHGLCVYDERVFKPTDGATEKPAAEKPVANESDTARRSSASPKVR
jgi:hypothetical protein